MKLRFIFLTILTYLFINGCGDVLDVQDLNSLNSGYVWDDENLANSYLIDLYAALPGWPKENAQVHADEMLGVFTAGLITEENENYICWPYDEIRKINILLQEIDDGTIDEETINIIKAQAKFLRAWHYFKMVVYHGGVPIITVPQSLEDDLYVQRNSTKETFDFIISDLDYAIANLPDRYQGNDFGRIDKSISMAFKAKVLLYEASPQYHPDNPYDNSYWELAYTKNKEVKEFLESMGFGLYQCYKDIWFDEGNIEVIMPIVFTESYFAADPENYLKGRREDIVRPYSVGLRGTRIEVPIWQFVESYPMKDGYKPGDANSNYTYDQQTFWENRDPRFYDVIVYNGSFYEGGIDPNRRQYTDELVAAAADGYYAVAGFYNKKALNLTLGRADLQDNGTDWVEIRFAEVLLNFAETACETEHLNEAVDVLKQIRKRAGIESGNNGMYGLNESMSREELRDAIMLERKIEFAFEGKRFWDLRRTRRLAEIDQMEKEGCLPTLKPGLDPDDGDTWLLEPEDFTYEILPYDRKEYINFVPDKYYFFPINQNELEKNPNLEQNKDWSGGTFDPTIN